MAASAAPLARHAGAARADAQQACERGAARAGSTPPPMDMEGLQSVLERAVGCGAPRAVAVALSIVHRLIAYGAIEGRQRPHLDDPSEPSSPTAPASQGNGQQGGGADQQQQQDQEQGQHADGQQHLREGPVPPDALERAVQITCEAAEQGDDVIDLQVVKLLLTAVSLPSGAVAGEYLLMAVRTCYNIVLVSEDINIQTTGTATLQQMLGAVMQRCAFEAASRAALEEDADAANGVGGATLVGPCERDALVVFRALCKLSLRDKIADGSPDQALLNKRLSLELVRHMYDRGSAPFRSAAAQATSVREAMCMAILRNSVAAPPKVSVLAAGLLASVYAHSRHMLKTEMGVMIPAVVLAPIEAVAGIDASRTKGEPQQAAAMPAAPAASAQTNGGGGHSAGGSAGAGAAIAFVSTTAGSAQALVDLFINYDMEVSAGAALFERCVRGVCAIASAATAAAQVTGAQRAAVTVACALAERLGEWAVSGGEIDGDGAEWDAGHDADAAAAAAAGGGSGSIEYESVKSAKATLSSGLALFNDKPAKGVAALLEAGHIAVDGRGADDGGGDTGAAAAVAAFLARADALGLSKTSVGEYLGSEDPAAVAVLKAYIAAMDFSDLYIDEAIRKAIKGFRLPGEAQKIDRIMEVLASKYCADNPGVFKSADTAYVLCYSIMMLHTDAHNPQVENKMSLEDFRNNNAGISEVEEVPVGMLDGIYERIVAKEIKLQGDDFTYARGGADQKQLGGWAAALSALGRGKSKAEQAAEDAQAAVAREMANMKRVRAAGQTYVSAKGASLVRPMLQAVGKDLLCALASACNGPVFAAKLLGQEIPGRAAAAAGSNGAGAAQVPLPPPEGEMPTFAARALAALARAACAVGDVGVRDGALVTLRRAATLGLPSAMRSRVSAMAAHEIVALAISSGDGLGEDGWVIVLETMSRTEALAFEDHGTDDALVARGALEARGCPNLAPSSVVAEQRAREANPRGAGRTARAQAQALWSCRSESARVCIGELERAWGSEPGALAARLWASASTLEGDGLVALALALCAVSERELAAPRAPRLFLLQGLVETGHYAASASAKLVWGRVWGAMAGLCMTAGCRPEEAVALRAVDSLRALASRLLCRLDAEEAEAPQSGPGGAADAGSPAPGAGAGSLALQNEILRPFAAIARRARGAAARELAVTAAVRLACGGGTDSGAPLRSGWRSVLAALTASAFDADANVVRAGQVALRFAFDRGLSQSPSLLFGDASDALFADCVACMAAFACAPPADADAALVLFGAIAEMLAGLPALPPARTDSPQRGQLKGGKPQLVSGAEQHVTGAEVRWWMLCDALVGIAAQCESSRRAPAIGALFALLTRHASTLDGSSWARVYERVVSPLFEVGRGVAGTEASDVWMAATVEATLTPLVALLGSCEPAMRAMTGKVSELLGELLLGPWSVQELAGAQLRALCYALSALGAGEEPWAATMEALESAASALAPVASQHTGGEGGTPLSPDSELAAIASSHDALFQSDESAASDGGAVTSAGAGAAVNVLHTVGSLALTRAVATVLTECGSTIPGGARFRCRELLGRLARDAGAMLASSSGGARDATLDPMAVDVLAQQEAEAGEVYMSMLMMEMDDGGATSAAAEASFVSFASVALRSASRKGGHTAPCAAAARALRQAGSRGSAAGARAFGALYPTMAAAIAHADAPARNAIADTMEAVVGPRVAAG